MFHSPTSEAKQQGNSPRTQSPRTDFSVHAQSGYAPMRGQQQLARLHSTYGNQAVLRMFSQSGPAIQTKLAVNKPGDEFEQEADRVADQVMTATAPSIQRKCSGCEEEEKVQRKCAECEEEEKKTGLQRKESGAGPQFAPPSVQSVLSSPGQALDPATRAFMEPRFGHDFSKVRVHTDASAAESARAVNALAYTSGQHVVFGSAEYKPQSDAGRRLLAHELTHVIQQRALSPGVQRQPAPPSAEVAAIATEVEELVRPKQDEKAALEKLNGLDQSVLLQVVKKLYDDAAGEYAVDKTSDPAAFEKAEGKRRSFSLLNGTLKTPESPATKGVDVPRLQSAFDAALNASAAKPKTKDNTLSDAGRDFIALPPNEGFCPNIYDDLTPNCGRGKGDCTIGIGRKIHDGPCTEEDEKKYKPVTKEEEAVLFKDKLRPYTKIVNENVKVELAQCQFDALVSLAYNGGLMPLLPTINAGKFDEMPALIKTTATKGGILTLRRSREADLFQNCNYKPTK